MTNGLVTRWLALTAVVVLWGGSPAWAQSEAVEYYGLDALGSVRVIFDQQGNVVGRMDYGPFGENLRAAIKFPTEQFAQLARDAESGQDYAQARNYSAGIGRFNAVDPVYAGLFEPQKWNRYSYVLNSPLVWVDTNGMNAQAIKSRSVPACDTFVCDFLLQMDLFWISGGSWGEAGTQRGSTEAAGWGGRSGTQTPVPPPPPPIFTPNPPVPPVPPPPPTNVDGGDDARTIKFQWDAFKKGCGEGAAIAADTLNPFGDPLLTRGYYSEDTPGYGYSVTAATISAIALDLAGGLRGIAAITRSAPRHSVRWKLNNNRYLRVGYSMWPSTQCLIPRLAIGTSHKLNFRLTVCGR